QLRKLAGHLRVVEGIHRILISHLRNQERPEAILRLFCRSLSSACPGIHRIHERRQSGTGVLYAGDHALFLSSFTDQASVFSATSSWPHSWFRRWSDRNAKRKSC